MYTDMKKFLTCLLTMLGLNTACGQGNYENADVNESVELVADSLVGEWRWVGKNVPELILVLEAGNTDPQSNGLKVESLYRYRIEDYKDPKMTFDGENIHIRKDLGENTYLELDLKPCGNDLTGRCLMVGIMPEQVDTEITLRRDYFEYDNK